MIIIIKITKQNLHISRYILFLIIFIVAMVGVGVVIVKISNIYNQATANWQEIKFAYEHPNLIKGIRQDFIIKTTELEASYQKKEPTAQDKLIETVAQQLEGSKN